MKKKIGVVAGVILAVGAAQSASAALVSVVGPNSSSGVAASIIGNPANALDSMATNQAQQGFDEAQNVLLGAAIAVDSPANSIAAGTRVNSQMIFLNKPSGQGGQLSQSNVVWTFDGPILGVMSDGIGQLEVNTTGILGAAGTNYPGATFAARGMENADSYSISGNTLTVNMAVSQPGDWIRVVTAIPAPGAAILAMLGMPLIGWARRRTA